MNPAISSFLRMVRNPFKFSLFLWLKLPMAAISGLRIVSVSEEQTVLRTRFRWLIQNPFKSTYWAVMGMAAEMSSGLLVMMYSRKKCAMYVTGCRSVFLKRALGKTFYTCNGGQQIKEVIEGCIEHKTSAVIDCTTAVTNEAGELIAEFVFTWSIKAH